MDHSDRKIFLMGKFNFDDDLNKDEFTITQFDALYNETCDNLKVIRDRIKTLYIKTNKVNSLCNSQINPYELSIKKNKKLRAQIKEIRWNVVKALYYEPYNLSMSEIAKIIGCSTSTIRSVKEHIERENRRVEAIKQRNSYEDQN